MSYYISVNTLMAVTVLMLKKCQGSDLYTQHWMRSSSVKLPKCLSSKKKNNNSKLMRAIMVLIELLACPICEKAEGWCDWGIRPVTHLSALHSNNKQWGSDPQVPSQKSTNCWEMVKMHSCCVNTSHRRLLVYIKAYATIQAITSSWSERWCFCWNIIVQTETITPLWA